MVSIVFFSKKLFVCIRSRLASHRLYYVRIYNKVSNGSAIILCEIIVRFVDFNHVNFVHRTGFNNSLLHTNSRAFSLELYMKKRNTILKPPYIFATDTNTLKTGTHLWTTFVVMRYNFLNIYGFLDFDYLCRRFSILFDCIMVYNICTYCFDMRNAMGKYEYNQYPRFLTRFYQKYNIALYEYVAIGCDQHQNINVAIVLLLYCLYL